MLKIPEKEPKYMNLGELVNKMLALTMDFTKRIDGLGKSEQAVVINTDVRIAQLQELRREYNNAMRPYREQLQNYERKPFPNTAMLK